MVVWRKLVWVWALGTLLLGDRASQTAVPHEICALLVVEEVLTANSGRFLELTHQIQRFKLVHGFFRIEEMFPKSCSRCLPQSRSQRAFPPEMLYVLLTNWRVPRKLTLSGGDPAFHSMHSVMSICFKNSLHTVVYRNTRRRFGFLVIPHTCELLNPSGYVAN